MDHVVWKIEVYQVILGMSNKGEHDFADHHSCRLGEWYFKGEGAQKFSRFNSFKQLDGPHAQVHNYGFSALKAFSSNDMDKAVKELASMESASVDVINLLTSLSNEIENES